MVRHVHVPTVVQGMARSLDEVFRDIEELWEEMHRTSEEHAAAQQAGADVREWAEEFEGQKRDMAILRKERDIALQQFLGECTNHLACMQAWWQAEDGLWVAWQGC